MSEQRTSNLVADLRQYVEFADWSTGRDLCEKAADEIERLTSSLATYAERNAVLEMAEARLTAELERVRSERDGHLMVCTRLHKEELRLRAAIEKHDRECPDECYSIASEMGAAVETTVPLCPYHKRPLECVVCFNGDK